MDLIYLIGGLALVLIGANKLTDGASSIAKRLNIPSIIIGLTIVAFGTSAPELTISISSALEGSSGISVGNIIGSNMFNTLLIVGVTALIAPIVITKNTLVKEIPLCILASVILFICANDILINNSAENIISRTDGLLLLCFFAIFLSYTIFVALNNRTTKVQEERQVVELSGIKASVFIILGLAALIYGGELFTKGAINIARTLGVSESTIGLTLVAGGTSLPELATSIVAAYKKNAEMAIGNAIGSNLFNIFLVLGASSTIAPLHLADIDNFNFIALIAASILLWLFGLFFAKRTITRIEGSILILSYFIYFYFIL